MTKARIREIKAAHRAHPGPMGSMIEELIAQVEAFQARARRGEDLSADPQELPLAAKVNPAKKARGTREEVNAYFKEIELTPIDAHWFWEKVTEGEKEGETSAPWKVGKQPVKDWKGRVRQWKLMNIFPSQKNGTAAPAGPARCTLG